MGTPSNTAVKPASELHISRSFAPLRQRIAPEGLARRGGSCSRHSLSLPPNMEGPAISCTKAFIWPLPIPGMPEGCAEACMGRTIPGL